MVHAGLIKQYRKETKNTLAPKGKLKFAGHIRRNMVHQERFYTSHQVYDKDHLLHQIINEAFGVVERMSRGTYRYGRCKAVQLNFPEVNTIVVSEITFAKLKLNRKSEPYRKAMMLARLIILNYSPNVKSGAENMLALMFDMNDLWEKYVLMSLEKQAKDWRVIGQASKLFWESKIIRPDIILENKAYGTIVIDTKWKNYTYDRIGMDDLRQIYVYNDFWNARAGMLLYPSPTTTKVAVEGVYAKNGYSGKIGLATVLNEHGKLNSRLGEDIVGLLEINKQ